MEEVIDKEDYEKFCRIYDDYYRDVNSIENINDKKLSLVIQNNLFEKYQAGRYLRFITKVSFIKKFYEPNRKKIISASFRMYSRGKSCCYGYIHSYYDKQQKRFDHQHIVFGPSLTSEDGEYKGRTISWHAFHDFFMKEREPLFDVIDDMITKKLNKDELSYGVNIHTLFSYKYRQYYCNEIDNQRFAIKIHILCWLHDFYAIHNKTHENHMNEFYRDLIYVPEDVKYLEKVLDLVDNDLQYQKIQLLELTNIINVSIVDNPFLVPVRIGQKMFPLNLLEAQHIDDVRFPTWREIFITNRCSNLSLNYVSPSFPFLVDWFFIHNTDMLAYDNTSSIKKYSYSKVSKKITKKLRKLDLFNFVEKREPISEEFLKVSQQVNRAINFADFRLSLSQSSLCLLGEYVGRTFRDAFTLSLTTSIEGTSYIFTEIAFLEKYIFELIYSFHCMNTIVGVIHGDPHVNNITLYQTFFNLTEKKMLKLAPFVDVFHINGKVYSFPYNGEHAMLIDFSKGIMRDREALKQEFDRNTYKNYITLQNSYFRQIVGNTFPELNEKYGDRIDRFLRENADDFFRLFSVVDTIICCKCIRDAIRLDMMLKDKAMEVYIVEVLHQLLLYVEKEMTKEFLLITADYDTRPEKSTMTKKERNEERLRKEAMRGGSETKPERWIQLEALEKFFPKYVVDADGLAGKNIMCLYNHEAHMKNDINVYEKWGNLVSMESRKAMRVEKDNWDNKHGKVLYDLFMMNKHENTLFDIEMDEREKDKLVIEPWMIDL